MNSSKKIKVAILGFGLSGSIFHAPFLYNSAEFTLVAVVSSNKERVSALLPKIAVFANIHELLNTVAVDLIIVATPNHTHYEMARIALERNKHVVVEKPFALNTNQAQELIAIAKQKNLVLCTYQNRRWDGPILELKKLLKAGVFGDIYQCDLHFDRYRPLVKKTKWKEFNTEGAGTLYDLGPHLLDHALSIFGRPEFIQADLAVQRPDAEVEDYFHLLLNYPKTKVILHSSSMILGDVPHIQVHGEKASFTCYGLDEQEENLLQHFWQQAADIRTISHPPAKNKVILRTYENNVATDTLLPINTGDYHCFYHEIYKAIRGMAEQPISHQDMLDNVRLIELAFSSYQSGKRLKLN